MINNQLMTGKYGVNGTCAVLDGYNVLISDERFVLMREKVMWWPAKHLLMVADIHFGKDAHLQRSGISVPAVADQEAFVKLTLILQRTKATTLLILGDLFHARPSGEEVSIRGWAQFCEQFPELEIVVVEGNHDRKGAVKQLPLTWRNHYRIDQFLFMHEPLGKDGSSEDRLADDNSVFTFCGHLHPSYRLQNGRREWLRLPVFWLQPKICVLPAFGMLTGGMDIHPAEGDKVAGVTPEGGFPLLGF